MVVDVVPATHHQVHSTVAPVEPPTQSRKVVSKGKAVSRPTMRPRAHKVTRIATPTPEVTNVATPLPPIAGPSWASHAPLFEAADRSGDEQVGKDAPTSSGKCSLGLPWRFADHGHPSFWYARLVEA